MQQFWRLKPIKRTVKDHKIVITEVGKLSLLKKREKVSEKASKTIQEEHQRQRKESMMTVILWNTEGVQSCAVSF
jgi:hypothetical protein